MYNCKGCIYRTTVEITKWHQRYSIIHEKEIDLKELVRKPACGFNPGKLVEVEKDRVSCKEFKSE